MRWLFVVTTAVTSCSDCGNTAIFQMKLFETIGWTAAVSLYGTSCSVWFLFCFCTAWCMKSCKHETFFPYSKNGCTETMWSLLQNVCFQRCVVRNDLRKKVTLTRMLNALNWQFRSRLFSGFTHFHYQHLTTSKMCVRQCAFRKWMDYGKPRDIQPIISQKLWLTLTPAKPWPHSTYVHYIRICTPRAHTRDEQWRHLDIRDQMTSHVYDAALDALE